MANIYGPVASRRFGQSIGINFLPPKTCTYSCVYCQLGQTNHLSATRIKTYDPEVIVMAMQQRLNELEKANRHVDTLTFVANGEPTLDITIGQTIRLLKTFRIPVAVITNASLMEQPTVRHDLQAANLVSVKIDTVRELTWHSVNRPYGKLDLSAILAGIQSFSGVFKGQLFSETMLVEGVNDSDDEASDIADFIQKINVAKAYLSLPLRPPCESNVKPPNADRLASFYRVIKSKNINVEIMMSLPETELGKESKPIQELCEILMVHPLTEPEILSFLEQNGLSKDSLARLVAERQLLRKEIHGESFYLRNYLHH